MRPGIYVRGTDDLTRALRAVSKDTATKMGGRIKTTAEPARGEAERLAVQGIRNVGPMWSRMRLGYARGGVYLAPTTKRGRGGGRARPDGGRGTPRPNLAPLLLNKSMLPAAENTKDDVINGLERLIDEIGRSNGF